ncbi:MAG: AAC(3) family N-acetyltransferase [Oscillospiraceae bacterium]|jgi:aminoglycoside N3'-acetyltransferase|nr:AAC(3) family N-acetyltransferase [Oscillospiraceae bacterium]
MTKTELIQGFHRLGVQHGMALEVHSSLSSFGYISGGANTVIEALMEAVSADGAIVMPSFTISALMPLTDEDKQLDIAEKSRILREEDFTANNGLGVIANTFRDRADTVLGKGTFRVCAWGKNAELHAAYGFGQIIEDGGYALLLGVDIYRMSSMHYMEDDMPPELKQKFAPTPKARAKYPENEWLIDGWVPFNKPWYEIQDEAYRAGLIKDGMIDNAKCMLLPVKPVVSLYRKALQERPMALYGLEYVE